ncbi:MAG: helix-turn-helix domain-containing protein [Synergistaceae bacterium]|nr:helix-turn-helix domain-containing protein [Synergistaceae bacterium]
MNGYDDDFLYEVLKNRDRRFDGRFFFGVTSTGIYCRPGCPARRPKRENCRFFESAAAAEKAGFRPCLRCRPELSPGETGASPEERLSVLASRALQQADGAGVDEIAASLGVSERHLRRVFASRYGVSPVQYARTFRLLFARRLILETNLSFTETAMASGFGSVRRMNALFRERYRCNPTELRRGASIGRDAGSVVLRISCRAPYAWSALLDFLEYRAIEGVEEVEKTEASGGVYRRGVALESGGAAYRGWVAVSRDEKIPSGGTFALSAEVSLSLAPVLGQVVARLKRLFDTDSRPGDVRETLGVMTEACPGLRVPGCFDAFEMGVRAILGQQITVRAAHTLTTRLVEALGEETTTPYPTLRRIFPTPRRLLETDDDTLGRMGIVRNRQRALHALAEFALSGGLEPRADIEGQIRDLQKLPGIGEWTAQYIAMRALDWPDAFPHTDCGVRAALGNAPPGEILSLAERWRPWRAYATLYLWQKQK